MRPAFPELSPTAALAAALNALLNAQPAARQRLQRQVGKRLRLALPLFPIELQLDETSRFLPLIEASESAPELTLTPLPSALPLLLSGGKLADLFRVDGDGLFASDISGALADFDWVLALRPYLGDIAASRVDQFLRGALAWRQNAHNDTGANLAEYAIYEQNMLADSHALRGFIRDVDTLREDVDRLQARLNQLEIPPSS